MISNMNMYMNAYFSPAMQQIAEANANGNDDASSTSSGSSGPESSVAESTSSTLPVSFRWFLSQVAGGAPSLPTGRPDLSRLKASYVCAVRVTVPSCGFSELPPNLQSMFEGNFQSMFDDHDHVVPKTLFLMPVTPMKMVTYIKQADGTSIPDPDQSEVYTWSFNKWDSPDHSSNDFDGSVLESDTDSVTEDAVVDADMGAVIPGSSDFVYQFAKRVFEYESNPEGPEPSKPDALRVMRTKAQVTATKNKVYHESLSSDVADPLAKLDSMRTDTANEMNREFDNKLNYSETLRTVLFIDNGHQFPDEGEGMVGEMIASTLADAATKLHAINEVTDFLASRQPDNVRSTRHTDNVRSA